jgi:hypothetical protein
MLAASFALSFAACQPVPLRAGETVRADVAVPPAQPAVNLAVIGVTQDVQRPIELHPTGVRVARGSESTIGIAGPGVEPGTAFAVIGIGFDLRLVRFGTTQGGGQMPMPAAVLSLAVAPDVVPGLYSLIAVRGVEYSVLAGSVEVF